MENAILRALSVETRGRLAPHIERVWLASEQVLYQPGLPTRDLYFPMGAQVSIIAQTRDGMSVEGGVVGLEGLAGLPALLTDGHSPHTGIVQVAGAAARLPVEIARAELRRGDDFQAMVLHYLHYLLVQTAQTALCNRCHPLDQRLSRWLLLVADAVGADHFHLTHEFLATMLGTHRPGVSRAAGDLKDCGCLRYHRGAIEILDRAALEGRACECYGVVRWERDRLLPHPAGRASVFAAL